MKLQDGYTLMHEHTTVDLSKIKNDPDAHLNAFENTVQEFKKLYGLGVRNILDVTAIGMGRNVAYTEKVAELTGIHIIHSTGFYKEPFLPDFVYSKSIEELADLMLKEIHEGIEGTQVQAGCIGEIGTSFNEMTKMEKKVFDAVILGSKQCDVMISTHTTLGTYALEQARYLVDNGVKPGRIVIGHMDLSPNLNTIKSVLETGVYVAFDTIGKDTYFPDESRAEFLLEPETLGYLNQVVLSVDITRKLHLEKNGGAGYAHLFTKFLPRLKEKGLQETSIIQMLVENPNKLLSGKWKK